MSTCGTYRAPPIRPEVLAVHAQLEATGEHFAFAPLVDEDGQSWRVSTKQGRVFSFLPVTYASEAGAQAAGAAWLKNQTL